MNSKSDNLFSGITKLEELAKLSRFITVLMPYHDPHEANHGPRVAELMDMLAREMSLTRDEVFIASHTGHIHDIGKISIPESVLNKMTKLTKAQIEMIRAHTTIGEQVVRDYRLGEEIEKILCPAIRHHHENYDGTGYPDKLKDGKIPLYSRMLRICDAYEAMTDHRPYQRVTMLSIQAIDEMVAHSEHFDPDIFGKFVKALKKDE